MNKVFVFDKNASDELNSFRGIGRFMQTLRENFPEWIFTANLTDVKNSHESIFINPFINFYEPPVILKKIAKNQIAVIHDLIPLKYPSHFPSGIRGGFNVFLNKISLKNYDTFITISETVKRDIINILKIAERKIKVIYPCPRKLFLQKNLKTKKTTDPFCLYVGDATWNKNIVNLALAVKMSDIKCVFSGKVFEIIKNKENIDLSNPWLDELRRFILEVKDDNRFIFPGYVSDLELIKLYEQAEFNILPSHDEGFGLSWLESASLGRPSLLSNIPVFKEISDNNAIFFNQNNPKDIADKMQTLLKSKSLRQELSKEALKRSQFFSIEKFKKDFLSTVELT